MNIEELYRYVAVECPAVPGELMRQAIVHAARDLCSGAHVWTQITDPIDLIDGQSDYDLEFPFGASPITAEIAWCGARELRSVTMAQISVALPDWRTATSSTPLYYNMAHGGESIRVFPTPKDPLESLVIKIAYEPTMRATSLPDALVNDHLDLISTGAKGRLMLMPNKQWSNQALGAAYRDAFGNGVIDERIKILHDRVPGTIRVQPRRFGA